MRICTLPRSYLPIHFVIADGTVRVPVLIFHFHDPNCLGGIVIKRQQSGFTMIELIMVIVILGILAAFALPRFADFGGDARLAAMQGAAGAVKSASSIVHAAALADPAVTDETETVTVEVAINLTNKYAEASEDGIVKAAQLSTDDFNIDDTTTSGTVVIADKTKSDCSFSYKMADGDTSPVITTTALTETNCN